MKKDIETIEKVLDNKATPEEAGMVAEWFAEEEGQAFLSRYMEREQEGLTEEKALSWIGHKVPERRMKARFLKGMEQSKKRKLRQRLLVAAVAIPFLFLGMSAVFFAKRSGVFSETHYVEVSVPYGERMQVMLQDGTLVMLNSGSKLRYPQKFELFNRTVYLSGEGYFKVAKIKTAPFVVDLKGMNVEVTGTKFNVKSYECDSKIWVSLEEGGVRLKEDDKLMYTLLPGDQVEYDRMSGRCKVKRKEDFARVVAWKDNSLNFYMTPLGDILKTLERQYDTRFVVRDSALLDSRFTLSTTKVNVADVLEDLAAVSHISFKEIKEKEYEVVSD